MKRYYFLLIFLVSCVSHKDIVSYDEAAGSLYDKYAETSYKLRPQDILTIKINSTEANTVAYFNDMQGGLQNGGMINNQALLYLNGYIIDNEGNIDLPLVGKIKASGRTVDDVRMEVSEKMKAFLKQFSVTAKLANYRVSVLGEVRSPGKFYVYETKVTLLQALGLAGDFTDFANRKRIKLMREGDKKMETYYLDLTRPDIIAADQFYLQPNDIVYVEPLKAKAFNINVQTVSVIVSAVSVATLILNVILNNQ